MIIGIFGCIGLERNPKVHLAHKSSCCVLACRHTHNIARHLHDHHNPTSVISHFPVLYMQRMLMP